MRYGDYQLGNVTISRVYCVEGLGHNLFSVSQLCDSNLEVAFHKHTCFVRNLEGTDLLSGSKDTYLYTISLDDMIISTTIYLLSKASKLVMALKVIPFELRRKPSHKPKAEDNIQEKLYLLHMDLCEPMRVESINGKKYILVIVDDYSRNIRTNNGTEFVNQTLKSYYEDVRISHQTLYNLFDKFASVQGETLYEYYWRFSQLINDIKFVTDVKLAKSLYTTNYDQLYAYLSQHKRHANEARIIRERYPDPLALVSNSQTLYNPSQSPQHSDSGLAVPTFQQGEDPIDYINKAMAFLSIVASRFPPSN
ncbi:retrovirus-related pol polyprotein from transposon TNT 1-94, partial [Tanacetum coccineum]